jgi:hypothetical protein
MSWLGGVVERYPWVLALVLPILGLLLLYKVRSLALRLSKERMKRLYDLTKSGRWRHADPIAWEIAVSDAFRCVLDGRAIKMALSRHNSMRMLSDCKYALGIVRLDSDGSGFVDNRYFARPSLKWTARGLHLISISPWIIAAILIYTPFASPGLLVAIAVVGLIYTPVFTWLALCIEAAKRLVEELDQRYPLAECVLAELTKGRKRASSHVKAVEAAG